MPPFSVNGVFPGSKANELLAAIRLGVDYFCRSPTGNGIVKLVLDGGIENLGGF